MTDMALGAQTHTGEAGLVSSRQAAYQAANASEAKKALGTMVLDVRKVTVIADYFVICGASTKAQLRAIVDNVEKTLHHFGYQSRSVEGKTEGRWALLDFGTIIVHVLQEQERSLYNLERFWNHALIVNKADWLSLDNKNSR